MQPADAPGPRAPPAESTTNSERSPSRRAASSPTALAVSNGSAAQRRTRGAFSPPQSTTTRAANQGRAAVRERQASRSANLIRDAARGAGTSVGATASTASSAAASAAPATSIDVNVLYLGPLGKNYKKPRLVHVVGSVGPGDAFDVRQANGVELSGVPRSRLSTRLEADPAVFEAAELAARKLRQRATPVAAAAETASNDDDFLYLGPLGTNYDKPRLVHVVGSGGPGNTFDVRQANGVKLSGVPRSRLSTRLESDPAVFQAAELAARKVRERTAAAANGLAPSADRLAQVAEAAQRAVSDITARTVCAVCCCTVQEASTVPVVVTEQPPTGWHAKLKATPAMGLHAELRAQYTIGDDSADVHPLWTEMCVNLVVNSTAAFAWRSLPPALTLALPCLRCAPGCCVQRHCTTQAQVSGPLTCATAASRASTASGPRPHQRTASPTATSGGTRRPCQGSPTSHNR